MNNMEKVKTLTRPILTGVGFLVLSWLVIHLVTAFGTTLPLFATGVVISYVVIVASMLAFWFGPRTLEAVLQIITKQLISLMPTVTAPAGPQPPAEVVPVETKPVAPAPVETKPISPAPAELAPPFDVKAFDEAVVADLTKEGIPVTNSNKLTSVMKLGNSWPLESIDQSVDYHRYLDSLAEAAFAEVFGYPYEEAELKVREPGTPRGSSCPGFTNLKNKAMAMGAEFYSIFLARERVKEQLVTILKIKEAGIDWKKELYPQFHTLTGVLSAKYLLK